MAKKASFNWHKFGHYSFLAGILLALIIALFPDMPEQPSTVLLVILGLAVGLLNIQAKEVQEFLIASLVLMVSASVTALSLGVISTVLITMWSNVLKFIAPAAIVVAIKSVITLAEEY